MAVAQGFSKITTSGSVFMYDTADGVNSFKGKPATNILTGVNPGMGNSPPLFVTSYGTESVYIPGLGKSVTANYCNIYNDYNGGSGICCPSLFVFASNLTAGVTGSTTYTYQIIYRTADGYYHENYMYRYEYSPSSYITEGGFLSPSRMEDLGDGWVHGWGTFTTNAATTRLYCYLFHYQYATQNKVQVAGIMLTQGTQVLRPNQFLAPQASRSNTQSLLPLISNSTLNVSDVSFNSVGTMTFDGTNDLIAIPNNTALDNQTFTLESVFYTDVLAQYGFLFEKGTVNTQYSHFFEGSYFVFRTVGLSTWDLIISPSTSAFVQSRFNHVISTYESGTKKIYVNGALVATATGLTGTVSTNSGGMSIGAYGGEIGYHAYWFNGQIPVTRIYNRALTPGEILNNYNHYKTKYNLP